MMTTPSPDTQLTVEESLKELREMLGPMPSFQVTLYVGGDEDQSRISSMKLPAIGGSTLQQCVAQVRQWKESQR